MKNNIDILFIFIIIGIILFLTKDSTNLTIVKNSENFDQETDSLTSTGSNNVIITDTDNNMPNIIENSENKKNSDITKIGTGFCIPSSKEIENNLSQWTEGTTDEAISSCEVNTLCDGFTYNRVASKYQLKKMVTDFKFDNTNQSHDCYRKKNNLHNLRNLIETIKYKVDNSSTEIRALQISQRFTPFNPALELTNISAGVLSLDFGYFIKTSIYFQTNFIVPEDFNEGESYNGSLFNIDVLRLIDFVRASDKSNTFEIRWNDINNSEEETFSLSIIDAINYSVKIFIYMTEDEYTKRDTIIKDKFFIKMDNVIKSSIYIFIIVFTTTQEISNYENNKLK
jgi:hypothetical protein